MFQLNIQNFRSFKNIDFDFSRINILIGPNNSGKSTLLKFFLMLKQSIDEKESPLTVKGKLVDLGLFEDVIYKGNNEKKEFEFTLGVKDSFWNVFNHEEVTAESIRKLANSLNLASSPINLNIKFSRDENNTILSNNIASNSFIGKMEIKNPKVVFKELGKENKGDVFWSGNGKTFELANVTIDKVAFINHLRLKEDYIDIEEMVKAILLNISESYLRIVMTNLYYLNPLNYKVKRVFEKTGRSNQLEVIVNWLAVENNEELRKLRVEKLSKLFKQMGIAEDVKLDIYRNSIEVLIKTEKEGFWINLADVGLGIPLQIPMLLHALVSEESGNSRLLLLEQPEIHIHPKLHENFIETLVGMGEKNTYFIETHSPFIVQKLQVMVKEGKLKPEEVAIYYFEKEDNETKATRYNIEEDGFMDKKLPQNFIGNSYNLAMQLLK